MDGEEPRLLGDLPAGRCVRRLVGLDVAAGLDPQAEQPVPHQHDPEGRDDERRGRHVARLGVLVERPVRAREEPGSGEDVGRNRASPGARVSSSAGGRRPAGRSPAVPGVLLAELDTLAPGDARFRADVLATAGFLARTDRPFDQDAQASHVTASAFVVSALGVVLVRHRLLGLWVQPGGHVEPDESPHAAACREVAEETGLLAVHTAPPLLVDVSVHPGPRGHVHHDCRWPGGGSRAAATGPGGDDELGWYLPAAAEDRCEPSLGGALARAVAAARERVPAAVASWPV